MLYTEYVDKMCELVSEELKNDPNVIIKSYGVIKNIPF
jgi:hypothetical protein